MTTIDPNKIEHLTKYVQIGDTLYVRKIIEVGMKFIPIEEVDKLEIITVKMNNGKTKTICTTKGKYYFKVISNDNGIIERENRYGTAFCRPKEIIYSEREAVAPVEEDTQLPAQPKKWYQLWRK